MSTARHKIFVGIDYGTTYSGIAYVLPQASDGREVEIVTQWPGNSNEFLEKVPSIIAYLHENEAARQNDGISGDLWGYEVRPGLVGCSWTKLLLDKKAQPTKYDDLDLSNPQESGLLRLPSGKTAVDVATDYLKKLYEHCMDVLTKHYADLLIVTPIEFWFTMPAMWTDQAQDKTRRAAMNAGFGTRKNDVIKMITEPEAGVIAAMSSKDRTVGAFEPGTGILVCDCGGGTVDLTSYMVVSAEPMLDLREACPGIDNKIDWDTGGKCGATSVDRNFHSLMHRRFGEAFAMLPIAVTGPESKFMREFEGIKKEFGRSSASPLPLSLVMDGVSYSDQYARGEIKLSNKDLQECFDPVTSKILDLIAQQKSATAKNGQPEIETIVVLGGFGDSPYLWKKIKEWCSQNGEIRCISPTRCWSAIARGAALRGLEGSKVPVKRCRYHYGTTISREFDIEKDDENDSKWTHPKTGKIMVRHCMKWCFKRNEEIYGNTRKEIPFTHYHTAHKEKQGHLKFYACSLSEGPQKITDYVELVGTIEVNFKNIDLKTCERYKTKNRVEYLIEFVAVVTLGSEEGTMQVAVLWNGKEYGSGGFKFSHDS